MNQERKTEIRRKLQTTREQTLRLMERVPDDLLTRRVHDFYSPVGWHFGHVGMTEEFWVLREALQRPVLNEDLTFLFANLPDNPKDNRVYLPSRAEILAYLEVTRQRVLDALDEADLDTEAELIADGYAWEFAHQHECQHQETIAELLHLLHKYALKTPPIAAPPLPTSPSWAREMVTVPGGRFVMGSDDPHGYDNEKRAHAVNVAPFALNSSPVTVVQWNVFLIDGGYRRPELWSEAGWQWRETENAICPEYWQRSADGRSFCTWDTTGVRPLDPNEAVYGISWYEAEAYACWAGRRLPTEAEWEFVAASGLLRDAGKVWEWTASPFLPYPGFRAFPYDGYSKDHMDGKHFVCRGGSFATSDIIKRRTFRNWYVPTYRQGFLGLRCAT